MEAEKAHDAADLDTFEKLEQGFQEVGLGGGDRVL